jgi:tRNA(Phe) wybutosine-synthesizing methylase Tyw3
MSSKPKIDKEILELIDTINQMINWCLKIFYPTTA